MVIELYLQPPVQVILSLQLPSSNVAKYEPEAVDTVLCTPDDGCGKHPKQAEWPCSEIKLSANSCILLVYYNKVPDIVVRL